MGTQAQDCFAVGRSSNKIAALNEVDKILDGVLESLERHYQKVSCQNEIASY